MRHHRTRRRRRRNPNEPVNTALSWLGGGAIVGAAIGTIYTPTNRPAGALNGAGSGIGIVGVGGLVVALLNKSDRAAGFATAGIGLGGLVLLGLAISLVQPAALGSTGMGLPGRLAA